MQLTEAADRIRNLLLTVTDKVRADKLHRMKPPYIEWTMDGQAAAVYGNNSIQLQAITGTVDLFTENMDDEPMADQIQAALSEDPLVAWRLNSITYQSEDDEVSSVGAHQGTKHYEWVWEYG